MIRHEEQRRNNRADAGYNAAKYIEAAIRSSWRKASRILNC